MTTINLQASNLVDPEQTAAEWLIAGPVYEYNHGQIDLNAACERVDFIRRKFSGADWWYINALVEYKLQSGDARFGTNLLEAWNEMSGTDRDED